MTLAISQLLRGTPRARPPAPNPLAGVITNPGLVQSGLSRDQQIQDANAQLRQARSQALIGFGSPELARSLGGTVDENTAAAAGQNPYSTLAQLAHSDESARRGILNSLAGHGLLHSGDLGYRQGEEARAYGHARSDATGQLLSQLNSYLQSFLGTSHSANDAYNQALLAAYAQLAQNPTGRL